MTKSDCPDAELMRRYANDDVEAFDQLFARYRDRAIGYFRRRTASYDRAADLYQELFLRVHRYRNQYDPARPFAPWFYRLAHSVLIDELRRSAHRHEVACSGDSLGASPCELEQHLDHKKIARRLLGRLSPAQADLILATKVLGLSYAEVAVADGRSVDALKQSASRTIRYLRVLENDIAA